MKINLVLLRIGRSVDGYSLKSTSKGQMGKTAYLFAIFLVLSLFIFTLLTSILPSLMTMIPSLSIGFFSFAMAMFILMFFYASYRTFFK